jgi:hypothetical protein
MMGAEIGGGSGIWIFGERLLVSLWARPEASELSHCLKHHVEMLLMSTSAMDVAGL